LFSAGTHERSPALAASHSFAVALESKASSCVGVRLAD
jgi:hypothetical protein